MEARHNHPNAPTNLAEYLRTEEEEIWQIIDGIPYSMSPSPNIRHQRIQGALLRLFANYLTGRDCDVFLPIDVCPFASMDDSDEDVKTVLQPDLSIICDKSKFTKQVYRGAPDLVVEILSPSTWKNDKERKRILYAKAGVKEYWIVDPNNEAIDVFYFDGNLIGLNAYKLGDEEEIKVSIFDDLIVNLNHVFAE